LRLSPRAEMGASCACRKIAGLAVQRPAAWMGHKSATALLTSLRMFLLPHLTAARM
jgi:hypothetical protein